MSIIIKKDFFNDNLIDQIKDQLNSYIDKPKSMRNQIGNYYVGYGRLCKVKLGKHLITEEVVAIKIYNKQKLIDFDNLDKVIKEIEILKQLHHPYLIQLYEIIETPSQILVVQEFATKGQLFDHIVNKIKFTFFDIYNRLEEDEAAQIFFKILNGLEYLQLLNIAHRDIKPENILLDSRFNPKIIDFSLAAFQKNQTDLLKTPCGSIEYAPPEVYNFIYIPQLLQGKKYNGYQADLWSCGVTLYSMICGYLPFESHKIFQGESTKDTIDNIIAGKFAIPEFVSKEAKDLIQLLMNSDPTQRPKVQQLRKHFWFKSHKIKMFIPQPLLIAKHQIPIDNYLVKQVDKFGFKNDETKQNIEYNRHTQDSTSYYLLLSKHINAGGKSPADLSAENFKAKVKPNIKNQSVSQDDTELNLSYRQQNRRTTRVTQEQTLNRLSQPKNQATQLMQKQAGFMKQTTFFQNPAFANLPSIPPPIPGQTTATNLLNPIQSIKEKEVNEEIKPNELDEKKELEKKTLEKKIIERKQKFNQEEIEKREKEKKIAERKEIERKDKERREAIKKENERRKEAAKREIERREAERKEIEKIQFEKKEEEKQEQEKKEQEKKEVRMAEEFIKKDSSKGDSRSDGQRYAFMTEFRTEFRTEMRTEMRSDNKTEFGEQFETQSQSKAKPIQLIKAEPQKQETEQNQVQIKEQQSFEQKKEKESKQKQIELSFRAPTVGLKRLDKTKAKRYILKSPYNPNSPSKSHYLQFYMMSTTSPLEQFILEKEKKNNPVSKVYKNANYIHKKKKKNDFMSLEIEKSNKTRRENLEMLNTSMPLTHKDRYKNAERTNSPINSSKKEIDVDKRKMQATIHTQFSSEKIIVKKKKLKKRKRRKSPQLENKELMFPRIHHGSQPNLQQTQPEQKETKKRKENVQFAENSLDEEIILEPEHQQSLVENQKNQEKQSPIGQQDIEPNIKQDHTILQFLETKNKVIVKKKDYLQSSEKINPKLTENDIDKGKGQLMSKKGDGILNHVNFNENIQEKSSQQNIQKLEASGFEQIMLSNVGSEQKRERIITSPDRKQPANNSEQFGREIMQNMVGPDLNNLFSQGPKKQESPAYKQNESQRNFLGGNSPNVILKEKIIQRSGETAQKKMQVDQISPLIYNEKSEKIIQNQDLQIPQRGPHKDSFQQSELKLEGRPDEIKNDQLKLDITRKTILIKSQKELDEMALNK